MFRYAIADAISGYQRYLSPRKGFCCAHRTLHGGLSCSEFGRRVVLRYGIIHFVLLQARRFSRCSNAYAILNAQHHDGEKQYEDLPWKQCLKSKKTDDSATCCLVFPW